MTILRAEAFYLPPPYLAANAWAQDPPAMRAIRWYEERAGRRIATDPASAAGSVYAQINHGRWVANCSCMSAQVVTPADPRMWCPECGLGWWQIVFPADVAAVEQSLGGLPIAEQNWWALDDPLYPTLEV
jgi:hypothetical protein